MVRIGPKAIKPKRLSDKEMRELLKSAKAKADKMPKEEDSFGIEVICSGKDIAKSRGSLKAKK